MSLALGTHSLVLLLLLIINLLPFTGKDSKALEG